MASWTKDKYDPQQLARRMEGTRSVNEKGQASFTGWEHREHIVLLDSMISFRDTIPNLERRRIINKAVFSAGSKGVITPKRLLSEISRLEAEFLRRPTKKYYLITSMSLKPPSSLKRYILDGCSIVFKSSLPNAFARSRDRLIESAGLSSSNCLASAYMFVRVAVLARSEEEGADRAIDAIDMLRGIWNLFLNRSQRFRQTFSGKHFPVNNLLLGPVHTLHVPSGKLATEMWWYEPNYVGPRRVENPSEYKESMYRYTDCVRAHLRKSQYSDVLRQAILRYVRALDRPDWDASFIGLWGVLEQLTNTTGDRYVVTTKRASFLWRPREYHRQILTQLRDARNRHVHSELGYRHIEVYLYQLKRYVERLIQFHLLNRFGFRNLEQAGQFMDLPDAAKELNDKIHMMQYARQFLALNRRGRRAGLDHERAWGVWRLVAE